VAPSTSSAIPFGGLVALAVALRGRDALRSLVIAEAAAVELLREYNEDDGVDGPCSPASKVP
jgi:hypothetical protein